ncbi:uncharacterized protein LOC123705583 [Colias croceus]|uniref:uncharacterized protein LOC123705583 n=1 Tax=Colias crocea TaxID=72248 RepID=UPI001E27F637|nr:uncharacterized protein LOC123705583 [Colias croceus]
MGASSLLLILAIHVIQNQGLQLHQIKRNPGILPLREGYAVVSNDTWRVIKVLDLKLIYEDLEFNINSYLSFRNQVHSCIDIQALGSDFITTELQTDYHMNYTIDKFEQLIPSSRSKRGLLNPLGSVIKIITGNLDNEDAIQFENTIEKLKTKQDSIIHKMTIVTEMVGSLLNVAEISNNNFIAIQNKLNVIDSLLNDTNLHQRTNEIIHTHSAFLHNFMSLYGLKTMPLSQPCKEIDEDRFLCPEILTSTLYKDDCLADLLRLSTNVSSCQPIPISIDDVKIDNVLPNRWILYVNVETVLTKVCENEVTQEFLHGRVTQECGVRAGAGARGGGGCVAVRGGAGSACRSSVEAPSRPLACLSASPDANTEQRDRADALSAFEPRNYHLTSAKPSGSITQETI